MNGKVQLLINEGYNIKKLINSGSYGDCYLVEKEGEKSVVVKVYKNNMNKECEHERDVYYDLHTEGAGRDWLFGYGKIEIDGHTFLRLDTYDGSNLEEYFFEKNRGMSISDKLDVLIKACQVISYMHGADNPNPYLHLDIKLSNFHISEKTLIVKPIDMGSAVKIETEKGQKKEKSFEALMEDVGYMSTYGFSSKKVREFNDIRKKYSSRKIQRNGKIEYLVNEKQKKYLEELGNSINVKDDIYSLICCVFFVFTGGKKYGFWLGENGIECNSEEVILEELKKNNLPEYMISPVMELFSMISEADKYADKEVNINSVEELIEKLNDLKEIYENKGFHPEVLLRNSKDYFEKHFSNVEIEHELLCEIEKA